MRTRSLKDIALCILPLLLLTVVACSRPERRTMEATGYCGCGKCNGYVRGRWLYLKLNVWNRYVNYGSQKGEPYKGRTASGARPRPYDPGLFAVTNLTHPWMIPVRVVFFPWMLFEQDGTIAADTRHYPFGTRMHVPGYGWGEVEDRGGAIKGPNRIDLFFGSHRKANRWGRKRVEVRIYKPDD